MTVTDPNPVGDPAPKQDPVGGAATGVAQPFRAYATEADFEAHKAKMLEASTRELSKLRKEIDTLKAATQTEDQKRESERAQAFEAERAKLIEESDRRAGFLGVAMSKGMTKEAALKLYGVAGPEWTDPVEAFDAVTKEFGLQINTRQVAGGGGRNANDNAEPEFTPEYVTEQMAKHGTGWYAANRAKVDAWRAKNFAGSGPRPLVPRKG